MKQAFLITAYKDFGTLYELSQLLSENNYVFIHVDQKSKSITDQDIEKLNSLDRCRAFRKYKIVWGAFTHVQAILELVTMALTVEDVSYMHLLTGEDYPVVPVKELDDLFLKSNQIFMSYLTPEQLPETVTVRYKYYNWFQNRNVKNKLLWELQHLTVLLQKKAGVNRSGIGEFTQIYKGLVYISMPREAAAYVLEFVVKHNEFWEDLQKCQVPEEFFFQTIFMNHDTWKHNVVNKEIRYMDWSRGDGSSPAYLTIEDYGRIKSSGCIFARKFHPEKSKDLRDRFRKEIE